ncbi:MAG: PilZ domain-containing protein [Desulfobacterales bacterium]|nr:PilZ domain-containing protein [Desulfobacterales bacterium]
MNVPGEERRQHRRYKIDAGAIVAFKKKHLFNFGKQRLVKLGPITDISMGGVAVQYIESKIQHTEYNELTILNSAGNIEFDKVPFKIVRDEIVAELPNSKRIKKRGMRFGKLSNYQVARLQYFINNIKLGVPLSERMKDKKTAGKESPVQGKKEKNKFAIQTDILNKYSAFKAKDGKSLPGGWLHNTYIPTLTIKEGQLLIEAIEEMVTQGIIKKAKSAETNYTLTKLGEKIINKAKI